MGNAHSHQEDSHAHGSIQSYMIGFFLSVILTVIPFWLVMGRPLEGVFETKLPEAVIIIGFAALQMIVHIIFFLHLHPRSEGGWNVMAALFTVTLVVIIISGSAWVMYHLHTNMMPIHDMTQMDSTGEGYLPSARER